MADTTVRYRPRDYRRICDVCGNLRNISDMHRQDDLWVCTYDADERVRTQLDRLNARERPFAIKPVPHPKPQNPYYPNTLETDDDAVFNFLAQQVAAQCRYESIVSGAAPYVNLGQGVHALSWAGRYYYDLIQANDRRVSLIEKAKVLLSQIADYLLTRQYGSATGPSPSSTRANDAFFGGILESGATTFITESVATGGLALLYAYRVHRTATYLEGARSAASYLRNVQANGSHGTNYTSGDSAGTSRLYTGSLASQVSTASGFYTNSLFYPSALLALEFWNELKTTDGDQSVGTTGTPTGFTTAPAALMSVAMANLRDCWNVGITDSTGTLINGFSSTTPREFFNAYPATKANFYTVTGTGRWEFYDAGASTGTEITSQTFARALSALYNYEGATSQVTTISDWLRSFTSNTAFETADDTSTSDLYRATTGDYDPTLTLATVLTVRDSAASYASIKKNGSSLYDWGAFGLLSRIWASRNRASFMVSRLYPLNIVQRFYDGTFNDGLNMDRVALRGLSGLTMQTGFVINLDGAPEGFSVGSVTISTPVTSPPLVGLVFWVEGDSGLSTSGGRVSAWANKVTSGVNPGLISEGSGSLWPYSGLDTLNGVPGVTFPNSTDDIRIKLQAVPGGPTFLMKDRNGVNFGYGAGETQARTVVAVIRPAYWAAGPSNINGGVICRFGVTPTGGDQDWESMFMLTDNLPSGPGNYFILFSNDWPTSSAAALRGPDTATTTYNGLPVSFEQSSTGFNQISTRINGTLTTMTPSTMAAGVVGHPANANFILGTVDEVGSQYDHMHGSFFSLMIYDHELSTTERTQKDAYISYKFGIGTPQTSYGIVNDAVLAAQFARSFREARA